MQKCNMSPLFSVRLLEAHYANRLVHRGHGGDGERALNEDQLARLQVPRGHDVPADVWRVAHLVGAAVALVALPVLLLVILPAVERHVAAGASLIGRVLAVRAIHIVHLYCRTYVAGENLFAPLRTWNAANNFARRRLFLTALS